MLNIPYFARLLRRPKVKKDALKRISYKNLCESRYKKGEGYKLIKEAMETIKQKSK